VSRALSKITEFTSGYKKFGRLPEGERDCNYQANVVEDRETIMARFYNGQNRKIANVIELQHYVELKDMIHIATKVETQLKRKWHIQPAFNLGSSSL